MSVHANTAFDFGSGFGFEAPRVLTLPGEMAGHAEAVITNNGSATLGKQVLQTALLIGFVSELLMVFVALGW